MRKLISALALLVLGFGSPAMLSAAAEDLRTLEELAQDGLADGAA